MTKKLYPSLIVLIVVSIVLGACAPTPAAVPTAVPPAPTTAPAAPTAMPPTAVPTAVVVAVDPIALFQDVIAGLPADKGFGVVAATALSEELADKAPFLLDVRDQAEIEKDGYIAGAAWVPIKDLLKNLDKLPAPDQPIVAYCASGHRGGMAVASLNALGYTNVRSLAGGIGGWKKAGMVVVTGTLPPAPKAISTPAVQDQAVFDLLDGYLSALPDGYYTITAAKLGEALADKPPFLVDVRTQAEVDKDGYIEGSVHLTLTEVLGQLDKLPAKDQPIVTYCGSGYRGSIVMMALQLAGYTNVSNLAGGLGAWKSAKLLVAGWVDWAATWNEYMAGLPADKSFYNIKADALNTALAEKPPFLVDLREQAEIEKDGYIKGAVWIPIRDFLKSLDKLPAQDQPIVVYCASGHRGGMAVAALRLLGYTDVLSLSGGFGAWKKASLAIETGMPSAPKGGTAPAVDATRLRDMDAFLSALPDGFYTVTAADLNTELAGDKKPFIFDVRTADEVAAGGYIEGAVLVPINDVPANLDKLPAAKDTTIVITCQSGYRGAIVLMALRMQGYTNVRNLAGGMNAWVAAEFPVVK